MPPSVRFPVDVTVPVSVMPLTVPVPPTEVTVPSPVPAPRFARAVAASVAPVPPLAIASVPPAVIVPDDVTGPPVKVRPVVPPDTSTDVTVPLPPPVAAIVMLPEPLVMVMPEPAVSVALDSVLPVELPMSNWPSVNEVCPVPP